MKIGECFSLHEESLVMLGREKRLVDRGERETGGRGSGKVRRQSRDAARKHAYLVDSPADKSDEPSLRRSITSGRRAFSPFSAWMLMFYFDSGN